MLVLLGFLSLAQAMAHRGWSMSVPRDYSTEEENLRPYYVSTQNPTVFTLTIGHCLFQSFDTSHAKGTIHL